jgi:outer membrane protein assembly factor BamD (BamD/ComL family)
MRLPFILIIFAAGLTNINCSGTGKIPVEEYFIQSDTLIQQEKYDEAVKVLSGVENYYPADTLSIIKSWNAVADIYATHLNNYEQSIASMQKVLDKYPDSPEAPKSLFKIGFTYENMVKDITLAKKRYDEFIAKYPNHELALSVKVSLEHLGESDEELLERLIKKNESLKDTL